MDMFLFICFGSWGLGVLVRRNPRWIRLAARGLFNLFTPFLR